MPAAATRIRRAEAGDAEACIAIARSLPEYFTPDVPEMVGDDVVTHPSWVATDADAGVIGFAIVELRYDAGAEILWAAVHPDRRNQGIGTVLVDHVLRALTADGIAVVEVKTLDRTSDYAEYVPTRAFWEGRGFVQVDMIDPLPGWMPGNPSAIYIAALRATTLTE